MMSWLLKLAGGVTGNPMLLVWIAAGAFGLGAITGAVPAWKYQAAQKEAVQAKYDGFVGQTKLAGEAAEAARLKDIADRKTISDRKEKDHAKRISTLDAQYRAALAAARMLPTNPSGGETKPLSSAAAIFNCPDGSADIAGRLEAFEVETLGLLNRGNVAIARTITCKEWIDEQVIKQQ